MRMNQADQEQNAVNGWWVPVGHWHEQRLWAKTGVWCTVRNSKGEIHKACILYGRDGWWDRNYEPVRKVVDWFKPAEWFEGANDMNGKEVAWKAYRASVVGQSPFRAAVVQLDEEGI